jgi:hypothetical protein
VSQVMEVKLRESGYYTGLTPGLAERSKASAIEFGKNETWSFVLNSFSMPHPRLVLPPLKKSLSGSRHQVFGSFSSILGSEESDASFSFKIKVEVRPFQIKDFLLRSTMFRA